MTCSLKVALVGFGPMSRHQSDSTLTTIFTKSPPSNGWMDGREKGRNVNGREKGRDGNGREKGRDGNGGGKKLMEMEEEVKEWKWKRKWKSKERKGNGKEGMGVDERKEGVKRKGKVGQVISENKKKLCFVIS